MNRQGEHGISWCDYTHNFFRAWDHRVKDQRVAGHYCEKIAPGCASCYAGQMQGRFQMPTFGGVTKPSATTIAPKHGGVMVNDHIEVVFDEKAVQTALTFKPRGPFKGTGRPKVFVNDMSDTWGWWIPDEWLERLHSIFRQRPDIDWLDLTKRGERRAKHVDRHGDFPPAPNVWRGISISTQADADRDIPHLLATPAAVRFLSVEPQTEAIDLRRVPNTSPPMPGCPNGAPSCRVDWVIVGGESGPKARPFNVAWARAISDQCLVAGVAFHMKQLGAAPMREFPS